MAAVGIAVTVVFAARAVASAQLQPERVISFLATIVLLYTPLKSLGSTGQGVTQGMAGARRLWEVLDEPVEPVPGALQLPAFAHEVRFERVSFRYRDQGPLVLRTVDLTLRRGEVIALVGPSGGGKTTLMNLVPRFADPTEGRVLLDGGDVREATLESLRAQVALVAQETFLFNDTVRGNIGYGLRDVSQERLEGAAKAARAHDFIRELPQGYDTVVGERGVMLSGGQRQRLAIARALLKDAPILLLDEATSALDTESEREVQRALDRLMDKRTCLVIAHRLSTIRHATRIAVLAQGRIVELGTHEELLARKGEYARLYELQFASTGHLLKPA
jgi:subfamily B ATP-binding cassette protein MsbA